MCLEMVCCPGLAISSTRLQLMVEFALTPLPSDNQIIRFNNCMQCLACLCNVLAMVVRECETVAHVVQCLAHLVFLCTAGCMAGQINMEKNYQIEKAHEANATHPNGPMDAPGQQQAIAGQPAIHAQPVAYPSQPVAMYVQQPQPTAYVGPPGQQAPVYPQHVNPQVQPGHGAPPPPPPPPPGPQVQA
eukprot:TRINITY_DN1968_c0_g1_i4.p1 TRINITY_DN1968_c0_g1~~TRINITY_DN1968_c0_g1_i4.p1  ORF type:complete len:188 (-),score=24.95 TRINITY_DN1968_c0_g1_i4:318-881(-)